MIRGRRYVVSLVCWPCIREKQIYISALLVTCSRLLLPQLGTQGHPGLRPLTDAVQRVRWAGTSSLVERVSVRALLPDSHHYITYDGSLTQPPCHETVTWVLVNRPVYITKQQVRLETKPKTMNSVYPEVVAREPCRLPYTTGNCRHGGLIIRNMTIPRVQCTRGKVINIRETNSGRVFTHSKGTTTYGQHKTEMLFINAA